MPLNLVGPLIGLSMLEKNLEPCEADSRRRSCPACGFVLNKRDEDWDLDLKPKGGPPLSITAEGFYVVSPAFRRSYDRAGLHGLTFRPLSCGYFEIRAARALDMQTTFISDSERARHIMDWMGDLKQFGSPSVTCPSEPRCQECGEWSGVLHTGKQVIAGGQTPPGDLEICVTSCLWGAGFWLFIGDGVRRAPMSPKSAAVSVSHLVLVADSPPPTGVPTLPFGIPGIAQAGAHIQPARPDCGTRKRRKPPYSSRAS